MHIGVNRTYPELAHHNFFYPDNLKEQMTRIFHDKQLPTDPTIYLVNVNKTDPSQAPAGCENIKILPHIPPIQDRPFTTADYEAFRDVVLTKLERMGLEDLRKHIITEDFWTPEDIERNYYSHRGQSTERSLIKNETKDSNTRNRAANIETFTLLAVR